MKIEETTNEGLRRAYAVTIPAKEIDAAIEINSAIKKNARTDPDLAALGVLHLLGYRRRRWSAAKLIVSRRKHDTRSPFVSNGR